MSDKVGSTPLCSSDGMLSEAKERCVDEDDCRKKGAALSKWVMCLFALTMSYSGMVRGGNLVVCPDCGNDVSRRALMCPKCGCAGDAIRAEGKQKERNTQND